MEKIAVTRTEPSIGFGATILAAFGLRTASDYAAIEASRDAANRNHLAAERDLATMRAEAQGRTNRIDSLVDERRTLRARLAEIAALETPGANATVKRMAKLARGETLPPPKVKKSPVAAAASKKGRGPPKAVPMPAEGSRAHPSRASKPTCRKPNPPKPKQGE